MGEVESYEFLLLLLCARHLPHLPAGEKGMHFVSSQTCRTGRRGGDKYSRELWCSYGGGDSKARRMALADGRDTGEGVKEPLAESADEKQTP